MAEPPELNDPWLVAVWPGMGSVAVLAGAYLFEQLGARYVHELPSRELFDVQHIEVKDGLARVGRQPRAIFFQWKHPESGRDLLIFIGEAQPNTGGYAFCHRLLDYAISRGISRVYTFAAMATQLHPTEKPRVFGVATDQKALNELKPLDVEILTEGQISGLNGVLLAAAAERGIPGVCLLGELPFFAAGVQNPRSSQAVLDLFTKLAAIDLDFQKIEHHGEMMEGKLLEMLEKMKEAARQQAESDEEGFTVPEFLSTDDDEEIEVESEEEARNGEPAAQIDYNTRRRIESLFEQASRDRTNAFRLKEELDRLGVFKHYEDRFLDLFKKAE